MEVGYDSSARGNAENTSLQEAPTTASAPENHVTENGNVVGTPQGISDDLEAWNPMEEDYSNLAFNAYREPTTQELRNWMPKSDGSGPSEDLMACYRSKDGDVRLFVNGIPNEMTQEGVKGLFSQVGKVVYCRVIPQRDPSRRDKFGFVGYKLYREAEHAIRKFDGFLLGQNMKLRVCLSKEKPKLPQSFQSMEEDFSFTNGLDEKLEDSDPDWGPPATPLSLSTSENSDSVVQQGQPGQGNDSASAVNTQASLCNGEDVTKSASKKPIAAVLEPLPCSKCGKQGRRRCGNCKVPYCSKECQRSHWTEHKMSCNWKTAEVKTKNSLHTSVDNVSSAAAPRSSQTNGHNENEQDSSTRQDFLGQNENDSEQHSSKPNSTPSQDPYSLNEDDFDFSEISQFANLMGIRMPPRSPSDSPSPQNLASNNNGNSGRSLSSPQESHYGFLQPLKRTSPKPLITEISSSVSEPELSSSVSEPEPQPNGSSRSTPLKDHVSMSVGATPSVGGSRSEDQQVVTTSNGKTTEGPQNRPYRRYNIDEVPQQNLSTGGSYEIVTTSISSPTLFWAQLYEESALASQKYLHETITAEYDNMPYQTYVPSANELCIAKFSVDNNWYRSKVDYIGNNGLIRVTHIDFGSSEDVDPSNIRRIKEDLVRVPRQGIKCALHLPECPAISREWSFEAIEAFKSKVLDVKCRVAVKEVKDSVHCVDVFDSKDNTHINDIFREKQQERPTLAKPVPIYPPSSQTNSESVDQFASPNNNIPHESTSTGVLERAESTLSSSRDTRPSPSFVTQASANAVTQGEQYASPNSNIPHESTSTGVLERAERTLSSPRNTRPSPSFVTQASANAVTQVHEISRKENASPLIHDSSTNAQINVSPMFSAESAFSPIPPTTSSGDAATNMETVDQSFCNEMQDPYYSSLPNSTGNPEPKTGDNNPGIAMSGEQSPNPTSTRSTSSHSSSKSSSEVDFQLQSPESLTPPNTGVVHRLPFKGVVTSVKSPWEFTVKNSDSQFAAKLELLTNDLNVYCSTAPFEVQKVYSHNELCAVKLNEDKTWHRARVVANFLQEGYKVILIDTGSEKVVAPQNMRIVPDQFKSLEPQSRICSLGGIRKPMGSLVWGKEVTDRFTALVLYRSFTFKDISKHKRTCIVDMFDEAGQPSVAMELINAGLAEAYIKRVQDNKETSKPLVSNSLPFLPIKNAITSANLAPKASFQIMATDIQSPALFSVQIVDKEANQRLLELCAEMNKYYADSTPHPDWQPRQSEVCAVFFKGSWFRAFIESVDQDSAAKIYCVDYGNTEVVSTSVIRPLASTFQSLPFCALRCSLGNIVPVQGNEWPKEVTEFIKLKIPISSTLNARLFYKGQTILFLDVFVTSGKSTESLVKLLVAKGLAVYKSQKEVRSPGASAVMSKDRNDDKFPYKSGISPCSLSIQGCAIAAAKLPNEMETFEGIVTHVKTTGEIYIHVADEDLAVQLMELTNAMNSFYSKAMPSKFEAKQSLLCAAKFSTDWRRAYILEVNSDGTATVYDVDSGKTEILPISQLQFLQPQFTMLQYFALQCKVSLPRSMSWTKKAHELFLSKVTFLVPITIQLVTRRKEILFVDFLIPESNHTLKQMIMSQNKERSYTPQVSNQELKPRYPSLHKTEEAVKERSLKPLNFAKALSAVKLPPEGQCFNAVITEFQSPQCFYIHSDVEMATKLTNLSADMNNYYNTTPKSHFQPMENQLCAAPFGSPNEWYRALVEKINANQTATLFFVDYGNTDDVPVTNLHQLEDRFSELPYCALNTSLAGVKPTEPTGWTSGANEFVKSKLPIGVGVSLKLISKRQDILFVDTVDPTSGEGSLCSDLVKNGLASSSSRNKSKSPCGSRSSPGSVQQSVPSPRESAISSANLTPGKEAFQVIATHITSPGSFAVQIADYEMACKVAQLGQEMIAHYQSAQYPPFAPVTKQLCAAQFTGNDEWYRGWIESIPSDNQVHIYYTDYGNSEVLAVSRLRPLEKQFTALPFSALACSIAHIVPENQGEWKQEAMEMFTSSVHLYQPINVKLVYKKRDCLYLDIVDPNESSATLSKTFVERGLAVWMLPSKKQTPREATDDFQAKPDYEQSKDSKMVFSDRPTDSQVTSSEFSPPVASSLPNPIQEIPDYDRSKNPNLVFNDRPTDSQVTSSGFSPPGTSSLPNPIQEIPVHITNNPAPPSKHFLQSVPMVTVPTNEFFNAMVCDIKKTGAVSLQVLTQQLKDLDALCLEIANHCSQVDHSPYCPVEGELCLACFSLDKNWYRAVVNGVLPNNQYKIAFVDFGNEDTVSPTDIRKVEAEFLHLPRQAYTGFLADLPSLDMGRPLEEKVLKALSERLLDKRVFARLSESTSEVELFNVGSDEKPAGSVNKEVLQGTPVNATQDQESSPLPVIENEFTALVSEVIGTGEIWLQRKDALESLNSLKADLNSYCESASSVPLAALPRRGDICLCKFSIDRNWYRAEVVETNSPDNILVLFLDYGNTEVVTLNSLRESKPQFMLFPFQGIKCYLFGVVQGHPDADDYVQQILNRELVVKVRDRGNEKLGVELEDYGVPNGPFNINENLIAFGHSA